MAQNKNEHQYLLHSFYEIMSPRYPDFFLAGAVKSGSTSLYYYLDQHPEVYMSPVKEPHHFSYHDMDFEHFRPLIRKRIAAFDLQKYLAADELKMIYRAYIRDEKDYLTLFKNAGSEKLTGEASTSYLWSLHAAENIRAKIPHAKIIIALRNPAERAFSHYLMDLKINFVKGSFQEAIKQDMDVKDPSWGKSAMYVQSGLYYNQVKRFYDQFPHEQLLVILYDELKGSPEKVFKKICSFLGIDNSFLPDLSVKHNAATLPVNRLAGKLMNNTLMRKYVIDKTPGGLKAGLKHFFLKKSGLPELSDEEKRSMLPLFEKDIVSLQQLTGKDLSNWLK